MNEMNGVLAWISEEEIARICPREYLKFKLERSLIPNIPNWAIIHNCQYSEGLGISDFNSNISESEYTFFMINSNICKVFEDVVSAVEKKIGLRIRLFDGASNFTFFNDVDKSGYPTREELKNKIKDEKSNIWVADLDNLRILADVNARIFTFGY
jgi:hypothetical protein